VKGKEQCKLAPQLVCEIYNVFQKLMLALFQLQCLDMYSIFHSKVMAILLSAISVISQPPTQLHSYPHSLIIFLPCIVLMHCSLHNYSQRYPEVIHRDYYNKSAKITINQCLRSYFANNFNCNQICSGSLL